METDYKMIGQRIRRKRIEKKMTQEKVADALDVTVPFFSRIENGNTTVNLKRLNQIADILETTPEYLFSGTNKDGEDYLLNEFSELLEKCTPAQKTFIYNVAELIIDSGME